MEGAGESYAETGAVSPLSEAMLTLGDQWNLLILQHAFLNRVQRFGRWRDTLGLSESVLADRLRELVNAQILHMRPVHDQGRDRQAYRLTQRGLDLWEFLISIWGWETSWVDGRSAWPDLAHTVCGQPVEPKLGCGSCGAWPVSARDTTTIARDLVHSGTRPRHHRKASRSPKQELAHYHAETLDILGDRWSTLILGCAFLRIRSFVAFKTALDIAPSVLSSRLRMFVELGVFSIVEAPHRRGHDYRLTEKGLAFFPVFAFMNAWATTWLAAPGQTPDLDMTHTSCRHTFVPALYCNRCGETLHRRTVTFTGADRATA